MKNDKAMKYQIMTNGGRNHYVDLLRCILMMMILILHTNAHALKLFEIADQYYVSNKYDTYMLLLLESFSIIAVNVFF